MSPFCRTAAVAVGLASYPAQAFVVPPSSSALFAGRGDVTAAAAPRSYSRSSIRMDASAGEVIGVVTSRLRLGRCPGMRG